MYVICDVSVALKRRYKATDSFVYEHVIGCIFHRNYVGEATDTSKVRNAHQTERLNPDQR